MLSVNTFAHLIDDEPRLSVLSVSDIRFAESVIFPLESPWNHLTSSLPITRVFSLSTAAASILYPIMTFLPPVVILSPAYAPIATLLLPVVTEVRASLPKDVL